LDDRHNANVLANQVRVAKGLDPTLGLYASYAYSEADLREEIISILRFMKDDLGSNLFDVAMLARKISSAPPFEIPVVPFCPMLTQGWNLLRARNILLPPALADAQDDLEGGLWTTFNPRRTQFILDAIHDGALR
jgi:hypothetical protein